MMRCKKCGCWIAPEWLLRWVEYGAILLAVVVAWFVFSGCSTISVNTPDGYSAHYSRIGNQDISGLRFEKSEGGLYRLTLDKQSADANNILEIIRGLVAR